jgi:hypothetical protein
MHLSSNEGDTRLHGSKKKQHYVSTNHGYSCPCQAASPAVQEIFTEQTRRHLAARIWSVQTTIYSNDDRRDRSNPSDLTTSLPPVVAY